MASDSGHKQFTHLHCHSHFSLLDGLSKIPDMVARAKENGMEALALTDHGAMYGVIDFYRECIKQDIKPIVGVEAYMAERSRFDKDASLDGKRYHLTLLAKNNQGYKNLIKLTSKAHTEGYYYKPRMDEELLTEYSDGLICLSGCPGSRFIQALKNGDDAEAKRLLNFYIDTFGHENTFIEFMKHEEVEWYMPLVPKLEELSKEFDLPIVGTWDSHYLHPDDREAHDTLLHINTNNANFKLDGNYSLIGPDEAHAVFSDIPDAAINTQKVVDLVDLEIDVDEWAFPEFPIPEGTTHDEELRKLTYAGFEMRGLEETKDIKDRIENELRIIAEKKYSSYFLCVSDFIRYSRENGIPTNTRGSAAGSMVSYLTGITNVNPMEYDLLFERFLTPWRPSLPDIDLDIADNRRDDVIDYAKEKYGEKAVAQIGTFGKMLARGVVRDVARALGYPYDVGDRIAKMIPMGSQGFPMTIDLAMDMEPDFKDAYENENDTREIIDLARKIEGCARHISIHAAGVVISSTGDVTDFAPVQFDPKGGKLITQYNMYTGFLGENVVGMPKFDFLGLRNLAIMADARKRVSKIRGIEIDIEKIPDNDERTYELVSRGGTLGVFQFASDGMKKWIRELKPNNLDDLIAMVALYRPGPMAFIPDYIERKQNPGKVTYLDPRLEPILKRTYGIIIYQEQILLIAVQIAQYSWAEADAFRKAVGKKIPEKMKAEYAKFTKGCIDNSMDKKAVQELWDQIETFAAYGFNKSHAASYGQLAYRTAYMKANYPAEYLTAIMTAESGNIEKVAEVMNEAERMGFEILPPDVNESFSDFTVVVEPEKSEPTPDEEPFHPEGDFTPDGRRITNKIRFGLRNIKNFGEEIGKAIIRERKENGPFTSLDDFLERVQDRNLNRKSIEALTMAGALDSFGISRGMLLANMETILKYNKEVKPSNENQDSLFATLDVKPQGRLALKETDDAPTPDKLAWEKELLGMYLSGHPLDQYKDKLERAGMNIKKAKAELGSGTTVVLAGIVEDNREILTKKGDKMSFVKLTDLSGTMEAVVFPSVFREVRRSLQVDKIVAIKGKLNDRNGERSLIVDKVKVL